MTLGLPAGTVTFAFTDIEGSTSLLVALGDRYPRLLARHQTIIRDLAAAHAGREVSTDGDAFFVVFETAVPAVAWAVAVQRALAAEPWPEGGAVRVRIGLHTGVGEVLDGTYVGLDVHRAARIGAAGHGGQILLSETARAMVEAALPAGVSLLDLGEHRLKDLPRPERLYQVAASGLASAFPPLRAPDVRAGNLPEQLTSFVGRETEIATVAGLVDGARLVTLTGPGGTGKTRLSIEVARRLRARYPDGAWFVALDTVRDPALVLPAIGVVLDVREQGDRPMESVLADHLSARELLLVLDNLEQILPAARSIGRLLAAAPRVRAVASSREPLRIAGEQEYPVPPLDADPAVRLFVERARLARPGFEPDGQSLEVVRRICDRLDRLPLAIELAAARARVLAPPQILSRLDQRLALLSGGGRDLPDRQRTLRGAIDWSYELLEAPERGFFARLAAFAGSASLDAIDAVIRPEQDLDLLALDACASLVEKSLLRELDGGDAEPRFGMLETIREFAAERLAEDPSAGDVYERHALHFLQLAESTEAELLGSRPQHFFGMLEKDHDNIRAATAWSLATGRPEVGLRIGGAIWRFWQHRGHLAEGAARLSELLAHPAAAGDSLARARGLTAYGGVIYWQGDFTNAERIYEEAVAVYRRIGDAAGIAHGLYDLAFTKAINGDRPAARLMQVEAMERFEALRDERSATMVRESMAVNAMMDGDLSTARAIQEAVVAYYRRIGSRFKVADSLSLMSAIEMRLGDHAGAYRDLRESVRISRSIGDNSAWATSLQLAALVLVAESRFDDAARLCGAYAALRSGGDRFLSATKTLGLPDPEQETRAHLDGAAFDAAFQRGRAMTASDALDLFAGGPPDLS